MAMLRAVAFTVAARSRLDLAERARLPQANGYGIVLAGVGGGASVGAGLGAIGVTAVGGFKRLSGVMRSAVIRLRFRLST